MLVSSRKEAAPGMQSMAVRIWVREEKERGDLNLLGFGQRKEKVGRI